MRAIVVLVAVIVSSIAVTGFSEVVCKEVVIDTTHYRYYYFGEDTVAIEEVQGDTVILLQGRIPDGIVRSYYENGQLWWEHNYKDGKQDGVEKIYYENGQLELEVNYKDGKPDGVGKGYYENGQLKGEINYKDDKPDGVGKIYYENGQLRLEFNYKDGKQDGVGKSYYENGQLRLEYNYKDGKLNKTKTLEYIEDRKDTFVWISEGDFDENCELYSGTKKLYHESTMKLKQVSTYKNGKHDGIVKIYNDYGLLDTEIQYEADKKILHIQYVYDKIGELVAKDIYNGDGVKLRRELYQDGKKYKTIEYSDGE